jgi:N-acetylglucosamine kinase-like BadF-type ATPase
MRYVLGVDGGGSKVTCLAANEEGRLLGYGRGGGVNTNYVLRQEAMDSLKAAITTALEKAGLHGQQIETLCISAPMGPDTLEKVMEECGIKHIIRAAEGETPRWAARFWIDGRVGVTVDAGTGSLARGWARDGREVGAGGWGAALGDEGSGYWISFKAMQAVLQAHDGRIEETMLTKAVLEHFGLSRVDEITFRVHVGIETAETATGDQTRFTIDSGTVVDKSAAQEAESAQESEASKGGLFYRKVRHKEPLKRHEIASFCPIVAKLAQQGDWKALEILEEAGDELGRLGSAIIKRLGMGEDEFVVVPFGGVFRVGDFVLRTFKETICAAASRAKIVEPKFEPEVGAVLLALDHIGIAINDQIIDAIEQSSINFPSCRRC